MNKKLNIANAVTASRIIFAPMHTLMNKITGMMLFLLPFSIGKGAWQASVVAIVITGCIATIAAIQEGHYIHPSEMCQQLYL